MGEKPWEPVVGSSLDNLPADIAAAVSGKSGKVELPDKVCGEHTLVCGSATELYGASGRIVLIWLLLIRLSAACCTTPNFRISFMSGLG